MFLFAELELAFKALGQTVRVPPPSWIGKALHWLTLRQTGQRWERETFDPAATVEALAAALTEAGLTDLVSATVDDEIVYRDDAQQDHDLAPALAAIAAASRDSGDRQRPAHLELVAHAQDDVGNYVVQLTADRLHPEGELPIRIRVYGLLRALDVRELDAATQRLAPQSVAAQLERRCVSLLHNHDGVGPVVQQLRENVAQWTERIEASIRPRLATEWSAPSIVTCAVRAATPGSYEAYAPACTVDVIPVLRGDPGMRAASFHLQWWLPILCALRAKIERTLIVDETGLPIVHIGEEAARLDDSTAFYPGQTIASPVGALDVLYFAGHAYEDALRNGGRLPESEGLVGAAAWKRIRERELGVTARYTGARLGRAMAALGVSSNISIETGSGAAYVGFTSM